MEILTLQFGHFSNHVGAHFWNFEDEVAALQVEDIAEDTEEPDFDFNRLHFQTERGNATSWHPRLVLVDQKGALGAFCPGRHVEPGEVEAKLLGTLWDHTAATHCAERVAVHPFQQDLDGDEAELWGEDDAAGRELQDMEVDHQDSAQGGSHSAPSARVEGAEQAPTVRTAAEYNFPATARTWTDFLKVKLPASSVCELQGWHHGIAPFSVFFEGLQIRGRQDEETTLDLARRQMELCDQLDAVHTVVDMHNGFGGVAETVLRWLHEEQPKSGKFVLAVQPEPQAAHAVAAGGPQDPERCAWVSCAFFLFWAAGLGRARVDPSSGAVVERPAANGLAGLPARFGIRGWCGSGHSPPDRDLAVQAEGYAEAVPIPRRPDAITPAGLWLAAGPATAAATIPDGAGSGKWCRSASDTGGALTALL